MSRMTLKQWQGKGNTFTYRDSPIFFRDEGKGEPLLLLHGFPSFSFDWQMVWQALKRNHRLIAPDMIGFGLSGKPAPYVYSIADQADLVEALLTHLRIKQVHILAHDYGVTVTQELLARFHERTHGLRIRSVCFLNGGLFPETHRPRLIQKLLLTPAGPLIARMMTRGRFERSFSAVFGPNKLDKDTLLTYWDVICGGGGRRVIPALMGYIPERARNRERWVSAIQRTSVPLRLINGPLDPVSGAHLADRYQELVPNPDVVYLDDCGHYPQLEQPEAMLRAYAAFMKRIGFAKLA